MCFVGDAVGGRIHEEGVRPLTPSAVLTDTCMGRRYLSERLTYHTANNAATTRSGLVGELSERLTCNTLGIHNQRHCR